MPSIKYKKKTYAGATFPVLEMTKAEYDALPEAKKMDGTVYMITDDTGGWEAEDSTYDNTESGLTATNVQDALDEINAKLVESGFEVPKNTTVTVPIGYYQISFLHSIETVVGTYLWAVGTAWTTPIAIKASSAVTITSTTSDGNVGTFKWDSDLNPKCVFTRLMQ